MDRRIRLFVLVVIALGCMCSAVGAEQLVDLWHNSLGGFDAIADAGDGSLWVVNSPSQEVLRMGPGSGGELTVLARAATTEGASYLSANPADGSVWIGDCCWQQAVRLAADGTELARAGVGRPLAVSVDPTDNSCWILAGTESAGEIVHVAADGTELSRNPAPAGNVRSLAAAPGLDSCWLAMASPTQVIRLEEQLDHTLAAVATYLGSARFDRVAVDPSDLTIWAAGCCTGDVLHLQEAADHSVTLLASSVDTLARTAGLWVDPSDHTCWVTDDVLDRVVQLDPATGEAKASLENQFRPYLVSGDAATGTLWAVSRGGGALTRATTTGAPLRTDLVVNRPSEIAVGSDSVWLYGREGQALRLDRDGTVLAVADGQYGGHWAAADPADNSCWLSDCCHVRVVHVDAEGHLLSETPMPSGVGDLARDATDGSCWVANSGNNAVVKVAADGTLVQTVEVRKPSDVAVDPVDGTVWVISGETRVLTHFRRNPDASITTLSTTTCPRWECMSVDPVDGSCVVGLYQLGGLVRVKDTEAGSEVTRTPLPYCCIEGITVDPVDRSIWFVGNPTEGIVHLSADGTELSRSDLTQPEWLDSLTLDPSDHSLWVGDRNWSRVTHVAVGLEADFSASVTGGAAPLEVSFTDLSGGDPISWSWDFGDGDTSTDRNPSHTYSAPGFYTVTLTATSAKTYGSVTKPDYIAVGFTDTPTDGWAFPEIIACVDAGIVTGYPGGNYGPAGPVNRGQMAVFMARAVAGGDAAVPSGPATPSFADVPDDHWAYKHIEYCVDQNIVQGYWNGYRPDEAVNRGQMAVYVARAMVTPSGDAGVPDYTGAPTFADVTSGNEWAWCLKHVEYCVDQGIVQGYGDEYRPANAVTRDQMAVYIQRAFALPLPEQGVVATRAR